VLTSAKLVGFPDNGGSSVGIFAIEMKKRDLIRFALALACLAKPALSAGQESKTQPFDEGSLASRPADFNTDIYYRNKLEFSFETGVLPVNIPFPFDVFVGVDYTQYPLHYTLVAQLLDETGLFCVPAPLDPAKVGPVPAPPRQND
jgi:hypothetical protein